MSEPSGRAGEHLRAIGQVLGAINRSGGDIALVYSAVLDAAQHLLRADSAALHRAVEGGMEVVAISANNAVPGLMVGDHVRIDPETVVGRAALDQRTVHAPDASLDPSLPQRGPRTRLAVPILSGDETLGVIAVAHIQPRPFAPDQIALLETFAQQVAIAIENVRLFNETKEALEQQTAVSDVLATISRSAFDLPAVLHTIVERAARLASADSAVIFRADGADLVAVATYASPGLATLPLGTIRSADNSTLAGRALGTLRSHYVEDVRLDTVLPQSGPRTRFAVPIHRDGDALGVLVVTNVDVVPFTERQRALIETFADQAAIAMENVRLFNETKEALERQTAVSEILRVMAGSPTDVTPVLQAIAESAARFCGAENVSVILEGEDGLLHPLGHVGGLATAVPPFPVDRTTVTGRSMVEGGPVHVHDLQAEAEDFPLGSAQARAMGHRTTLATPLVRAGRAFGAILLRRGEVRPFTEKQVELVRTFADQAVIAIDNVRLFNETKEALERQTAVSDILKVISASPTDIQPVLDAIASSAARFTGAEDASVLLVRDDIAETRAHHGPITNPASVPLDRGSVTGAAIVDGRLVHIRDVTEGDDYPVSKELSLANDEQRTVLAAPLMRDGRAIGAVVLRRREPRSFSERQVDLVRVFADQAVIAMENVRLFNETKESLEQQTAIADVLKVISRSAFDLQPVLETVTERATRLSGAMQGVMYRVDGDVLRYAAGFGPSQALMELNRRNPIHIGDRGTLSGRVTSDKRTVHIPDVLADPDYTYREAQELGGFRAMLGVPLVREGNVIGVMSLWRTEPAPFGDREIAIVETFADQAAIAIENVRLFNETKEALDQQTATSEVLQSISRSAFDLQGVLDTVVERAAQLCGAEQAWMRRIEGDQFRFAAYYGSSAELRAMFDELRRDGAVAKIDHRGLGGRAVLEKRPIHVHDIVADEGLREASLARRGGGRTALAVPMLRDGEPIGAIVVARNRVAPFNDREIRLVETFADQAVIAIENVRLFHEIQEQSRRLEIAGRHKSEFLANMSHELRTPLNAIIGFSEVLLQGMFGPLNEKQREYQQDVLSSGRHLLSLINDILDLAKIEAGRVELELSEFSLPAALENGVTMIRERAARHGIRVDLDVDSVDRVVADERKVKQIVFNLLSNAVKFTGDGGRVAVRASREDGEIHVAVRDTGIGIDEADRDRIFQEFQQAGRDPERSREGTGLGLALTKRYVELHGGRIWVESQVGSGSTFTFALPVVPHGKEG